MDGLVRMQAREESDGRAVAMLGPSGLGEIAENDAELIEPTPRGRHLSTDAPTPATVQPVPETRAAAAPLHKPASSEMLRQLRAVLEVHPATAHRYFAAEHLVAIQHLITEGVPVPLARPEATVDMKGTELTSSQPGEFAGIRPGDKITVVIDDVAVRRTVKFNSHHAAAPEPDPEPAQTQRSKPKLSRRILQSIFDQLDAEGRGVVSQRELLLRVEAEPTLAAMLQLRPGAATPASPRQAGTAGESSPLGAPAELPVAVPGEPQLLASATPPLTPQLAGWDDGSGGMNSSAGMQPQPVPPTPDKQVNFEDFAQFLVSSRAHLDR